MSRVLLIGTAALALAAQSQPAGEVRIRRRVPRAGTTQLGLVAPGLLHERSRHVHITVVRHLGDQADVGKGE